jgi:nicotinamidase-related amidase
VPERDQRAIIVGQVTEQCVLDTALDPYIRHFEVVLQTGAVAGIDADLADAAVRLMERNTRARLTTADACLSDLT